MKSQEIGGRLTFQSDRGHENGGNSHEQPTLDLASRSLAEIRQTHVEHVGDTRDILVSRLRIHSIKHLLNRLCDILTRTLLKQIDNITVKEGREGSSGSSRERVDIVRQVKDLLVPNTDIPKPYQVSIEHPQKQKTRWKETNRMLSC